MLRGREGMLYFVFNSDVIAVVVAHNIGRGEFVAQVSQPPLPPPPPCLPSPAAASASRRWRPPACCVLFSCLPPCSS